jgi:hypothetical protein
MSYSLYYTDCDMSERDYLACKSTLIKIIYNELDDALGRARQITEHGGVPWEIESEEGTKLRRHEITEIIRVRRRELAGRPKVY